MARLTKGMYGDALYFDPVDGLFGLRCGQMRHRKSKITHNSGWYNKLGEARGWGDLAAKDFRRISKGLKKNELFIILGELDSCPNSFTRPRLRRIRTWWRRKFVVNAPGIDYVAKCALFVIAKNRLYYVNPFGNIKEKVIKLCGLRFKVINRDAVKALMLAKSSA